jgi:3-methylfumaryl-CoA hydratase
VTEQPSLDQDFLRRWIGRREVARDAIGARLVREFRATLDLDDSESTEGDAAPLGIHWCLAPPAAKTSALGPDGHPMTGEFLPPVPLPRRMWAGSALRFADALRIGDVVERHSRIVDVVVKQGRSGSLCFVTVDHAYATTRGLAISERQDIVYRGFAPKDESSAARVETRSPVPADAGWHRDMKVDPVLLFRYSALTFNGHRIHYDRGYATGTEGYRGLVVHGPLQATLLLEHAARIRSTAPRVFRVRALQPLFDSGSIRLAARQSESRLELWIEEGTRRTMEATATW